MLMAGSEVCIPDQLEIRPGFRLTVALPEACGHRNQSGDVRLTFRPMLFNYLHGVAAVEVVAKVVFHLFPSLR